MHTKHSTTAIITHTCWATKPHPYSTPPQCPRRLSSLPISTYNCRRSPLLLSDVKLYCKKYHFCTNAKCLTSSTTMRHGHFDWSNTALFTSCKADKPLHCRLAALCNLMAATSKYLAENPQQTTVICSRRFNKADIEPLQRLNTH